MISWATSSNIFVSFFFELLVKKSKKKKSKSFKVHIDNQSRTSPNTYLDYN